jgi:branched-chain amino acid transport system permease protein
MVIFLTIALSGIGTGCVYGLVAVSYNVVYRASGVFSFAQGQLVMLGAMAAYTLTVRYRVPIVVAFAVGIVFVGVVSILVERIAIRPLRGGIVSNLWILSTLGAGLLITAIAERIWGTLPLQVPPFFSPSNVTVWGVEINTSYLPVAFALVLLIVAIYIMERQTLFGKSLRALALNRQAAILAGVPVSGYAMAAFGLGGIAAGLAGFLTAPVLYADPTSGFNIGILAFAGWAVGGFGSNAGAALGGIIIGLSEQLSSYYVNASIPPIFALAVLLLVMLLKPSGFFGKLAARQV